MTANSAPGACTSDTIASYVWYKKDKVIAGASSKQYSLPGNSRSDSDDYKCQVTTANQNTHSSLQKTAVNKNVNFLCMLLLFTILSGWKYLLPLALHVPIALIFLSSLFTATDTREFEIHHRSCRKNGALNLNQV